MNHLPTSTLSADQFSITAYKPKHQSQVNQLLDMAFGADRKSKSSYKLRETCQKIDTLSAVIFDQKTNELLASIAYWQLDIAGEKALLLGPLAVNPDHQGLGLGKFLMAHTLKIAQQVAAQKSWKFTLLVGDLDYYQKAGFKRVPHAAIDYPQPTDPDRVLFFEFEQGALQQLIDTQSLPLKLNQS
ncbi:MAG: N-acetyltransferase [Hyphomicrobiales bacterium]